MSRVPRRLAYLGGGVLLALTVRAANAPVDADLLEFLGSVDSDEAGWHDYLGRTDVAKVAAPGAKVAPTKPADRPPPKSSAAPKVES